MIALTASVFATSLIRAPLRSGGWIWDAGNALGFLGLTGLLYLFLDVGAGPRAHTHKLIGCGVIGVLTAHVLVLWLPDQTLWHYVSTKAPGYMLAGLAAFVVTWTIIILALPRNRRLWHLSHRQFRRWHHCLSIVVIVTALWHVLGSGFYVDTLEAAAYCILTMTVLAAHRWRSPQPPRAQRGLLFLPGIALAFVCIKALPL